jgi:hypothetical protein
VAYRSKERGSRLIDEFCRIMREKAKLDHMADIIIAVSIFKYISILSSETCRIPLMLYFFLSYQVNDAVVERGTKHKQQQIHKEDFLMRKWYLFPEELFMIFHTCDHIA